MRILVCVKQVPDPEAPVGIARDGLSLSVGDGDWRMNRFDEFAVEEALRMREAGASGIVEAVTVGPARAAAVLRRALAMGADEGLHILCGEEGRLPGDVAAWIAAAVRGRGDDLILTGAMSEDSMHAQTGPILAERLGLPCVTAVIAARLLPDAAAGPSGQSGTGGNRLRPSFIRVERELEGGLREALELPLPAVIAVQSGINRPRYPALSHVLRARSQLLHTVSVEALPAPPRRERVVGLAWAAPSGKTLFLAGTPGQKADRLAALLGQKALL